MRFYADLARFWPLLSPVEDYAEEAAEAARLLGTAARPVEEVLELGAGGGHNAFHLRRWFRMTLADLSPDMLACSRALNPECEHVEGDLRTVRLARTFDAVFVHDAIHYMAAEADLAAALRTVAAHLAPGGVALLCPDFTLETFAPGEDAFGRDDPAAPGRGVRVLEWTLPPRDGRYEVHYAFLLREASGEVRCVHDVHVEGVFPRATWLRLLDEAGLDARLEQRRLQEGAFDAFVAVRRG